MLIECAEITDADPLRQGDVFRWLDPGDDPWRTFGIIVTADCDIVQEKHRGVLSYVPLLRLLDYLRLFYLPRRLGRALDRCFQETCDRAHRLQSEYAAEFSEPLSEAAIDGWLRREAGEAIADDLGVPIGPDRDAFVALVDLWRSCYDALDQQGFEQQVKACVAFGARVSGDHGAAEQRLWRETQDHIEQLPGDAFFVGSLGSSLADGYIAYLRLVREVRDTQIALKPADLSRTDVLAQRISRLTSPYVYRLTQQLADVFAAIGLPAAYEANRAELLSTHPARPS